MIACVFVQFQVKIYDDVQWEWKVTHQTWYGAMHIAKAHAQHFYIHESELDIFSQIRFVLDSKRSFQDSILNTTFNEMNTGAGTTIRLVIVDVTKQFWLIEIRT